MIIDGILLVIFTGIQIFTFGLIYAGLKRILVIIRNKEIGTNTIKFSLLLIGIAGLSFYLVWNTLGFMDKFL